MNFVKLASLFLIVAFLTSCARPVEPERDASFYKELGDSYQAKKKYKKSIEAYENALMMAESPEDASVIQLALADSYFLYKEYNDAIPVYETYLDVYSSLPEADMALLRVGLSHYNLMNKAGRSQDDTISAIDYFNTVKERNPALYKENDLEKKTAEAVKRLEKKELIVGKYYARILKREPAILRFKYLLEHYPNSEYYSEASYRLIKLLVKENKLSEAQTYATLLKMKHPESKYVKKAAKYIAKAIKKQKK